MTGETNAMKIIKPSAEPSNEPPVRKIITGDVIWTPPGVKHWHGASPESAMTHIACQEMQDGKNVDWMEKVTDQEYKSAPE